MNNDALLEPSKYYNEALRDEHNQNVLEFWDDLVKKSGINPEENARLVNEYDKAATDAKETSDNLHKLKGLRTFLIILACICALIGIFSVSNSLIVGIILFAVAVGALVLLFVKIIPLIKNRDLLQKELDEKAAKAQQECYTNMASVNKLLDEDCTRQIIEKSIPLLTIDKSFNSGRLDMINSYGTFDNNSDPNSSTLEVMSGEIHGNPFIVQKTLEQSMGVKQYEGELIISWEEYSYDSDGKRTTTRHTQTLRATIEKPIPVYSQQDYLIYANEAAPHLSFSRKAGHAEQLSDKQLEKKVKKDTKAFGKMEERAIKKGESFTTVGNTEFESLFNALDRDNETEFRLLFTPLAQQNMVDFMRNSPYGDDFAMIKRERLNMIAAEHTANWDMNTTAANFFNYDLNKAKEKFVNFNNDYFKHFFCMFAPLLSIPLYQQLKTNAFIFKDSYPSNFSGFESEVLANQIGAELFADPLTVTRTILKTRNFSENDARDQVSVTAYSFNGIDRTEYVSVYGKDGRYHDVPVNWVEYIPLVQEKTMKMQHMERTESEFHDLESSDEFRSCLERHSGQYAYKHGLFAYLDDGADTDIARIK